MQSGPLMIELLTYSLVLWLGLYLMARDPANPRLRLTGSGLLAYAFSLAGGLLAAHAPSPELAARLARLYWPLLFLPAIFWFGATVNLLPEAAPLRLHLGRIGGYGLPVVAVFLYLILAGTNLIFDFTTSPPQPGPAYFILAGLVLLPMFITLLLAGHIFQTSRHKRPYGLLLAATLFFTLGSGLLIFPLNWLPRTWLLLAMGLDFVALGVVIAWLDALEQGETLLPEFFRTLDAAGLMVLLFGGPVVLTIILGTGLIFPMIALLVAVISLAIVTQVLADPLQTALDTVALRAFPQLRQARADLRLAASALSRVDKTLDPETMDEAEFVRLTRRALSNMGNLPRLASTPLTRLPLIEARLKERQAKTDTLVRAAELKQVLTESICRLKPPGKGEFGTSEEWRHYNALYFPYVVGLKPYSRRTEKDGLDPVTQEALEWFRTYVPERTLYNWQNAAAELVARDLQERQRRVCTDL